MSLPAPADCATLNDAQRAALDLDRDLLVDAGAGAGKTRVLALRYLALLEEGRARVPEIVAFTFTDKAAAEMRERVQGYLDDRLAQLAGIDEAKPILERLARARGEFHRNAISTVHGFCRRVLRDWAWEAGIEPGTPLMDEREQARARYGAVSRVLQRLPGAAQAELAAALEHLGSLATLQELASTLTRLISERHVSGPALARAAQTWADPDTEVARRREQVDALTLTTLAPVAAILRALPLGAAEGVRDGDSMKLALGSLAAALEGLPLTADELARGLLRADGSPRGFSRLGSSVNWRDDGLPELREGLATAAQALADGPELFALDEAHERRVGAALRQLHVVFEAAREAYARECAGRLDFLDLELRALDLLRSGQPCVDAICKGVRYLLIDEFQDTNPTQAELFERLLSRHHQPGRLFAVGDAKQSIYGFRGSDVAVFNDARAAIPARNGALAARLQKLPYGLKCENRDARRRGVIELDTNYRSRASLLEIGNQLFERIFGAQKLRRFDAPPQRLLPETTVDGDARPALELHLLKVPRRNDDNEARRADEEAELCAQLARGLRDEGLEWNQVAVLVRRGTRNGQFRAAFDRHGIPLLLAEQGGLLRTQEALDCLNLLRVMVDPGDDVAALGLLRSPFCGLSDATLTEIGLATREQRRPLLARVRDAAVDDPVHGRFFAMLDDLTARPGRVAPSGLLLRAFSACGYALAIGSGPQAEQRLANLERMLDVVREIQRATPGPAAVCRELLRRLESDEDDIQGMPEGDAHGVRLMTIHKSKGMEFEAVIVPDLGREPRNQDTGILRAWPEGEEPAGLHLRLPGGDDAGRYRPDFAAWRAGTARLERDQAEERRVLYVAFTRARTRLLMVGRARDESRGCVPGASLSEQILGALDCAGFGKPVGRQLPGLRVQWLEQVERAPAVSRADERAAVAAALDTGEIALARPLDASLVQTPPEVDRGRGVFAPREVELGVLVHRALELGLRGGEVGFVHVGASEVQRQARNAAAALKLLARAKRELSEWRVFGERGGRVVERRIDLLRVLDGDVYEIVDYKTDALAPGESAVAAARRYQDQLGEYRALLADFLAARGRKAKSIRTLICFTAPEHLSPQERVVEIK